MTMTGGSARLIERPEAVPLATKVPFSFVHINKCGGSSVEIALGLPKRHSSAAVLRKELSAEEWARRFTFSIVRNPFDRIVSIYYYRVRINTGGLGDRHINLNDWIEAVWGARDPRYWENTVLLAPAWDWLCGDDGLIVDQVAKLETIDADWPTIAARLGVEVGLEQWNSNHHPHYRQLLTDRARAVIETAFAEDLRQFGYAY